MSDLLSPSNCLLAVAFLYDRTKISAQQLRQLWIERYQESQFLYLDQFTMGEYYSKEMGEAQNLSRFFGITLNPFKKGELISAKLWADQMEKNFFSQADRRWVNIDIGRLNLENFELATGKNFNHRIYLEHGIYSDLTYLYHHGKWEILPWTYPDYQEVKVMEFFAQAREQLLQYIKKAKTS